MPQFTLTATSTTSTPAGTTTTTTTRTETAHPFTYKQVSDVPGTPAEVFDFYAGTWVGPEILEKKSIWGTIANAPDDGSGSYSFSEIPTPAGVPAGRTRAVDHSSGARLVETLYLSDPSSKLVKYALVGPLSARGGDDDLIQATAGLRYDFLNVVCTVAAKGDGSQITWEVDGNASDVVVVQGVLKSFYDLCVGPEVPWPSMLHGLTRACICHRAAAASI